MSRKGNDFSAFVKFVIFAFTISIVFSLVIIVGFKLEWWGISALIVGIMGNIALYSTIAVVMKST